MNVYAEYKDCLSEIISQKTLAINFIQTSPAKYNLSSTSEAIWSYSSPVLPIGMYE